MKTLPLPLPLLLLSALLLLALPSCSTKSGDMIGAGLRPAPTVSRYLKTESGGFVFHRGDNNKFESCHYVLLLTPLQRTESTLYLRTRFENPARPARPLEVDSQVPPGSDRIQLESPPVRGLRPGRNYTVEVLVFDSPERTHAIGLHQQLVQSMVSF